VETDDEIKKNAEIKNLAEVMHMKLCKLDHTEHCAWHYGNNQNLRSIPAWTHQQYYDRAAKLIDVTGLETADIIKVVENLP
jgi:hypothetical protein